MLSHPDQPELVAGLLQLPEPVLAKAEGRVTGAEAAFPGVRQCRGRAV